MNFRTWAACLAFLLLASVGPARAIIVITDGPNGTYDVTQVYTTDSAYTGGSFKQSGSQYEGTWGDGAGTVIGPHSFLTSSHLSGNIGDTFSYNNQTYTTTGSTYVGNGMTLWNVSGTFSQYAPIYANSAAFNNLSTGNSATLNNGLNYAITSSFGYGLAADGQAVTGPTGAIQGYLWNSNTSRQSWGASSVAGYVPDPSTGYTYIAGAFLPMYGTGTMSATFADRDSGGGTFVNVNGTWELAGVNYGVNAFYAGTALTNPSGPFPSFAGGAAMFDQDGFTSSGQAVTGPQDWYATNISPAVAAQIGTTVPEAASLWLLAAGSAAVGVVLRRKKRRARPTIPS